MGRYLGTSLLRAFQKLRPIPQIPGVPIDKSQILRLGSLENRQPTPPLLLLAMRGPSPPLILRRARARSSLRLALRPNISAKTNSSPCTTGPNYVCRQCRSIQISQSPTTETPGFGGGIGDAFGTPADATRDVAGMSLSSW